MKTILKIALDNSYEITISKKEFMEIACQEATEELAKVYKKPNRKYEKAMAQFSFILARITFELFDKPQILKARAEQTAPEETTTEPTEEVQEEPTEETAPEELSKEKRYFKVVKSNDCIPDNFENGDIGELIGIDEKSGLYLLANSKWGGHNANNTDLEDHCWWFIIDEIEEVKTEE